MTGEEIVKTDEFRKCSEFHGHICPGLCIGFRAAKAGMERLRENRAEDEELLAIVETNACSVDAVQVLTGCTFGKGNFIYHDYGKMVFSFVSRNSGRGVRLSMKPGAFEMEEEHQILLQKALRGQADESEIRRFQSLHFQRACRVLELPLEALFDIKEARIELPEKAEIAPSTVCESCGEPTMATKIESVEGKQLCRACVGR